jgi:fatty acid desaturase
VNERQQVQREERTLLVGWIAITVVVLEAVGLAVGAVVWGLPALIVVGPLLLASVVATVVLWLTVVPWWTLRATADGRGSRSGRAVGGPVWPSDGGGAAGHVTYHSSPDTAWYDPGPAGDGASSGSSCESSSSDWTSSDSGSSGSSDSSSSSCS